MTLTPKGNGLLARETVHYGAGGKSRGLGTAFSLISRRSALSQDRGEPSSESTRILKLIECSEESRLYFFLAVFRHVAPKSELDLQP